ncbi:sugar ABC transporter substrate-binding protein [Pseudonocardia lutea]|uniref:Sugar ABC transporter substrate-binding protein n=1 Tax=Pseudonocardia lutea TaxID=2172015 RepID=A0ABW1I582_9PSEU
MRTSRLLAVGASAVALLLASACGGGGSASVGAQIQATNSLDGGGKLLVAFMPTAAATYVASDIKAVKDTAAEYHYEITVFQNNFDQAQQDQQVQQFLASGQKPAAVIWWPSNVEASVNSVRQLARIAPVIQINQGVSAETEQYVAAYAGANDGLIGTIAGQQALEARKADVAAGRTLHSGNGNLIEFSFPSGYKAAADRHDGFTEATKAAPFDLLRDEPATGTLDAADGFNHASQVLPKFKAQGVDYVYAQNLDMGSGIVEALEQNGYQPGKDVTVVAGNCSGNLGPLQDGKVYSAVVQPPLMEGRLAVRTAVQLLASGKVTDETVTVEPSDTVPELTVGPVPKRAYLPAVPLTKDCLATLKIWGLSGRDLCS